MCIDEKFTNEIALFFQIDRGAGMWCVVMIAYQKIII